MKILKRFIRLALAGFLLTSCAIVGAVKVAAQMPLSVWFMPAGNSPDINELFVKPDQWAQAKSLVSAFAFSPGQLQPAAAGQPSLLKDLQSVDAFRVLKTWGIDTVVEVPAVKEWDCAAHQTPGVTVGLMKTIYSAGGVVRFLDMDEPLISALGLNSPKCHLDIDSAAGEVAAYAHAVMSDQSVIASGVPLGIVDIEAYPSVGVQKIEAWLMSLQHHGFKPSAFHLDPNINYIEATPAARARLAGDLQELQRFLRMQAIPFGIIVWSGYDPIRSDEEYYNHAMTWVRAVHDAIGRPDRVIFESWVKRSSLTAPWNGVRHGCSNSDPAYCGSISVPLNLSERGSHDFSHTRLIADANSILNAQ